MENYWLFWAIVIGSVFAVLLKLQAAFSNARSNPLSKIPGPWDTKLSGARLKLATISGALPQSICNLHDSYGPVVRLSPTTVSTSDPEGYKAIYNSRTGFPKSEWYLDFVGGDRPALFSRINREEHAARRRVVARGLQKTFVRGEWQIPVYDILRLTVQRMGETAKQNGGVVDIYKWWMYATSDVAGLTLFGDSFGMIESGEINEYVAGLHDYVMGAGIAVEMPFLRTIAPYVPIKAFRGLFNTRQILQKYEQRAVGNARSSTKHNVFSRMLQEAEKEDPVFNDLDIASEATNLAIAGADTTGITLTYLTWAVLGQPAAQAALEAEVAGLAYADLTDETLEKLPVLNAVVQEALRLYTAAPGPLPRSVPPEGTVLCGYALPAGTVVSAQAWTLHRRRELWGDDARVFDYSRWLPENVAKRVGESARGSFSPWGGARHDCLGRHLATMQLRLGTALFFREFPGARIAPSMKESDMDVVNFFLNKPKGYRCLVSLP